MSRAVAAITLLVLSVIPLGATVLPPLPDAAISPDGRVLVVVDLLLGPPDLDGIRAVEGAGFRVLVREDRYSLIEGSTHWSRRVESEIRHWSTIGGGWSGTTQRALTFPFVSNSGKHVVFLSHASPLSRTQTVLAIHECAGYSARHVRDLRLEDIWTDSDLKSRVRSIATAATLPWYKGLGFDFSLDGAHFVHTTPTGAKAYINLGDGKVRMERAP